MKKNKPIDDREFREKFRGEKLSKWKPLQFKMFLLFVMIGFVVTMIGTCVTV